LRRGKEVNTEKSRYLVTRKSDKEWEIFDTEFLGVDHFEMRLSLNPFLGWVYVVWPKGKALIYLKRSQAEAYAKNRGFVLPSEVDEQIRPLSQHPNDIFDRIERNGPRRKLLREKDTVSVGFFNLVWITGLSILLFSFLAVTAKIPQEVNFSPNELGKAKFSIAFRAIPDLAVFDLSKSVFDLHNLSVYTVIVFIYIAFVLNALILLTIMASFLRIIVLSREVKNESN
jgi:hypothetical protein